MAKNLFIFLGLFFFHFCYGQQSEGKTDSLLLLLENTEDDSLKISLYIDIAQAYLYTEPKKTVEFCRERISLSKKIGDHFSALNAYILLFNAQLYYGAHSDSLLQTIQLYENHVNTYLEEDKLLEVYWTYALYYNNIKQTDKEIEAYIKALNLSNKYHPTDNNEIKGALMSNIGGILLEQEKYDEALEYFENSLKIVEDPIAKCVLYLNIGSVYKHKDLYEEALDYFRKSYNFCKEGTDIKGMAVALMEEGMYFDHAKRFEKANQLYNQSYNLIKDNDIGSLLPTINIHLAKHYQKRKDLQAAIKYGEMALAEIEKQRNYEELADTYEILHQSYSEQGNFKKAYEIRSLEMAYKDSVGNAELLTNVEALKTEFEVEQKEIENNLLKAEALSNQKTIQNRNIAAIALLLGLLLILSWTLYIYRINRQKQKHNEQLEETVAKRTLALEKANKNLVQANYELKTFNHIASHDIKEPLRNIGSHIGLVYRKLPEALQPQMDEYFTTINSSTAQLYTIIEDFARYTKLSKNDVINIETVDLNQLVDNLRLALIDEQNVQNATIVNHGLNHIQTNASMIYIVLKKIIENGLKFNKSASPTVSLSSQSFENYVEIQIIDNGIGIDPAYQEQIFEMFKRLHHRKEFEGSGMGLAIVKLLMDKLDGSVKIESHINKGSTFILRLPINP